MFGKINKILLSFYFLFTSLLVSVIIVLNLTPLYSITIKLFDLANYTGLTAKALMEDYTTVIKYLQFPWINELKLKYFPMSEQGAFHFYEVKKIFFNVYALIFMCIILGFILYYLHKQGWFKISVDSLNYFFYTTITLILVTLTGFYMNFTMLFNKFHEIFFNNDYWIFDYITDPIILALPEEFFMICAISIVLITLIIATLGKILYSKLKNNLNTQVMNKKNT